MVFLALPALQRSQRDTQRRQDWAGFITQISNYQTNNRGKLPGTSTKNWEDFINNYLRPTQSCEVENTGSEGNAPKLKCKPEEFVDPDGEPYYIAEVGNVGDDTPSTTPTQQNNGGGTQQNGGGTSFVLDNQIASLDNLVAASGTTSNTTTSTISGTKSLTWDANKHEIYVYLNATCNGENAVESSGSRKVAIRAKFEGGGVYCGNN